MKRQWLAGCSLCVVGASLVAAPAHAHAFRRALINSEYPSDSLEPLGFIDNNGFADGSASFAQAQVAVSKASGSKINPAPPEKVPGKARRLLGITDETEGGSKGKKGGGKKGRKASSFLQFRRSGGSMKLDDASDFSEDSSPFAEIQVANSGESKSPASFLQVERNLLRALRKKARRRGRSRRSRSPSRPPSPDPQPPPNPSPQPTPTPLPEDVPKAARKRLGLEDDSGGERKNQHPDDGGDSSSNSPPQGYGNQGSSTDSTRQNPTDGSGTNDPSGGNPNDGASGGGHSQSQGHHHSQEGGPTSEQGAHGTEEQGAAGGYHESQQEK